MYLYDYLNLMGKYSYMRYLCIYQMSMPYIEVKIVSAKKYTANLEPLLTWISNINKYIVHINT